MIAVDTNVLVYASDPDALAKHDHALALVEPLLDSGRLMVPTQVYAEFCHVARRKLKLTDMLIERRIDGWRQLARTEPYSADDVIDALRRSSHDRIAFFDALILITCERAGARFLLSEDLQPGGRYGKVTVLDPFDPATPRRIGIR